MGYKLERLTTPKALLALAEIKAHLRVTGTDEDAHLANLALIATAHLEGPDGYLNRALPTQNWRLTLGCFPGGNGLRIPLPPTASIVSVKYDDTGDAEQTVATTVYELKTRHGRSTLVLQAGEAWPGSVKDAPGAVRVEFTAGYGEASDVPAAIRMAVLLMVGSLYGVRETVMTATIVAENPALQALLEPYRVDAWGVDEATS